MRRLSGDVIQKCQRLDLHERIEVGVSVWNGQVPGLTSQRMKKEKRAAHTANIPGKIIFKALVIPISRSKYHGDFQGGGLRREELTEQGSKLRGKE